MCRLKMVKVKRKKSKVQKIISLLKLSKNWIRYGPFFLYWCFYDYLLTFWTRLKKIDHIGVYVKIMSPSEHVLLFKETDIGYGYAGHTILKVGFKEQWITPEAVEDLLNHEVLHQIIKKRIGYKESKQLDEIHKSFSFICENGKVKVWKIRFK